MVSLKLLVIYLDDLLVVSHIGLVEHAQHLLQPVVDPSVQQWNLHHDAVMLQALHEGVGHTLLHLFALIVVGTMAYIDHRLVHLAYAMSEQIDGNHGNRIFVARSLLHVFLVAVLQCQIAAEAQCLRGQPCLLQFYQHQVGLVFLVQYRCRKIYAEHGDCLFAGEVRIFVSANLHLHDLLLQQCREKGLRYAVVFHQILEYSII